MAPNEGVDIGITDELSELIAFAAERALLAAGCANPFIPILTLETEDGERSEVILAESIDDPGPTSEMPALNQAKEVLRGSSSSGPRRYVIATDQFLTLDGKRVDAAVLEAGERGMPIGATLAQRYKRRFLRRTVAPIGIPAYLGEAENLLK